MLPLPRKSALACAAPLLGSHPNGPAAGPGAPSVVMVQPKCCRSAVLRVADLLRHYTVPADAFCSPSPTSWRASSRPLTLCDVVVPLFVSLVQPGTTCVIYGLGGVGLSAVIGCRVNGAARIIGIDINKDKFAKAKKLGVSECIDPNDCKKPIHEVIAEITDGGADYSFECVGKVETMASAIMSCHYGFGICTIIGVAPSDAKVCFDPMLLLTGRTVKGAFIGGLKCKTAIPKLVDDYLAKKFDLDELVTHKMKLDQIMDGFKLLHEGKSIRTVIEFDKKC